MNIHKTLH